MISRAERAKRNILADDDHSARIVDFGLSGFENEFRLSERGGVGCFFEPEYARAARDGQRPPSSSMSGDSMPRRIAEEAPLPLIPAVSRRGWPLKEVLAKAPAKSPADRFASVGEFAAAVRASHGVLRKWEGASVLDASL